MSGFIRHPLLDHPAGKSPKAISSRVDIQEQSAMQLLEAIPKPPAPPTGTAGGYIDTWA